MITKKFPFKALITGSQAYGEKKHTSDTDLVVCLTEKEIGQLQRIADEPTAEDIDREKHYLNLVGGYSLRFGRLNLICVPIDSPTGAKSYEVWRKGTALLKKKAKSHPVTRDHAIKFFARLREKAGLRANI